MKIGFIGLGLMGRGMAANIQKAGYALVVHDLNRASADPFERDGVEWAATPRDVGASCDVVFTSLPKPRDVLAVLEGENGLGASLSKGKIWLDLSTNSLTVVRDIHARLAKTGVHFLDAPVSGGPAGAASRKLAIWVGGEAAIYEQVAPILASMADAPKRVGDIGAGTISKLVHNTIASTINHAVAEMMTVGVKAGMDALDLYSAIRSGAMGRMRAFDGVHPRWLADNLDPATFALELLHKDVALGVELATSVNAPAPLATLTRDDLAEAVNRGWGRKDAQAALILKQERAGIEPISAAIDDIRAVMGQS
jgi:3-hydroxyisobutyrate dehydrogenase-like beta-hydroxyacid dehydrogenase